MNDLIYRQAAIDEIARWIGYIDEDMILRIQTGLKKVPSAQPEIVRCKECKYASKCYGDVLMRSRGGGYIYCPVEYCSRAERRTDE